MQAEPLSLEPIPRVAVVQRILPEFRYELFRRLADGGDLGLRVIYGEGQQSGAARNTDRDCTSFAAKIPTIVLTPTTHRVLHPDLFRRLGEALDAPEAAGDGPDATADVCRALDLPVMTLARIPSLGLKIDQPREAVPS